MVAVLLDGITVHYSGRAALDALTLRVEDGEAVALLGPSGSGKTTVLRTLAGLLEPDSGDVMFDLRKMNGVPPAERNLAMVFQDNVLFPNMNVRRNVGFPLSIRRRPVREIASRVEAETRAAGIANLLQRSPSELSAGQQQIVQIARAMVRRPSLLLVDEPFARLDPTGSSRLRTELRLVQSGYGVTALYATHNYIDAMGLADRVVVIEAGSIRQVGSPSEIYSKPTDVFVATFVGSPEMAILQGDRTSRGVAVGGLELAGPSERPARRLLVGVRPESWEVVDEGLEATVTKTYALGVDNYAELRTPAGDATLRSENRLQTGARLHLRPTRYHVFDPATDKAVHHG